MDIIPIQASSVPCEWVFSSGKETMTPRRGRISADLMESLQLLKYSFKKGRSLDFTAGMSWRAELKAFELAGHTAAVGDADAYRWSLEEPNNGQDDLLAEDQLEETMERDLDSLEKLIESRQELQYKGGDELSYFDDD